MTRRYHTLIGSDDLKTWHIEFGDYLRSVVKQEWRDLKEGHDPRKHYRILTTDDDQASINAAVAKENH